jgi:hypothetical protein
MTKKTDANPKPDEKLLPRKTTGAEALVSVADELARTVDGEVRRLEGLLSSLDKKVGLFRGRRPTRMKQLSLRHVVDYFIKQRPHAPEAVAAAAFRRLQDDKHFLVRLFFLDADGQPLQGDAPERTLLVSAFDEELSRTFAANNVIIFS